MTLKGFISFIFKILPILAVLIFFIWQILSSDILKSNIASYSNWSIIIILISIAFTAMIGYLNKGIGKKNDEMIDRAIYNEMISIKKKMKSIESMTSSNALVDITGEEKEKLICDAKKRIVGNTIRLAEDSLKEDISKLNKNFNLHKLHADMVLRLESEIDRLNRRGGFNIGIGTTIAVIGIGFLAFFVYSAPVALDGFDFLVHLLPKLSFVLVVELFAYFFLSLYKNGFEEIKYFQNEITNIDMKVMSLKYSQGLKNEDMTKELALHLMKTERNFILEKGQTTVSIEKDKLQSLSDSKLTSVISEIIKMKQK